MKNEIKFVYFAGEPLGVPILKQLLEAGLKPGLVVANPDRKSGRGQKLTPPPVKVLAEQSGIPVWQPETLKDNASWDILTTDSWDLFVVVAYNHILPRDLIDLPRHQTINLHPSLLPKLRGASPIRSAILNDQKDAIGVSIIILDEQMDHGDIIAQEAFTPREWPLDGQELDQELATQGAQLLARSIPLWVAGQLERRAQNHNEATYCTRLDKSQGLLSIDPEKLPSGAEAKEILAKIRAFSGFPGTYFFTKDGTRIKINQASLNSSGTLILESVTPEGKRPMSWEDFLQR